MFTNGLSIVAQPDRLMFLEMVGDKSIDALHVGEVAQNYDATLKMADYRSIGINFRSYAPQNSLDAATACINNQLLAASNWQQYDRSQMRASINFNYDLGDRQLNLAIDSAIIQFPTPLPHPAVVFSGTFSYNTAVISEERIAKIAALISNWKQELNEFNSFIAVGITSSLENRILLATSDRQESFKSVVNDIKIVDAPALPPLLLTLTL